MLDELTVESFLPHVGEMFRVSFEANPEIPLALVEARALASARPIVGAGRRQPFALLFRGAGETILVQRIYRVEHDRIGGWDIFLVPVGRDGGGVLYEAIFT